MPPSAALRGSEPATFVELVRARSGEHASQLAYRFLDDAGTIAGSLTFNELDTRARAIAAMLQERARPGDRLLLLYPPGLDFLTAFFGSLYAGLIAVPAYPPDPMRLARSMPRLRAIFEDAEPRFVLATEIVVEAARALIASDDPLARASWLTTERVDDAGAGAWRMPPLRRDSVAFLQYTSGSTSAPKGVVLSHANLLANHRMIREGFETTPADSIVSWLPLYHDMGLIGTAMHSLVCGVTGTLLSPATFLRRPMAWLRALADWKGTVSGAPNFAYDLCVRKTTLEERVALDLSRWTLAFCGAEPVRADTIDRFAQAFAPAGFRRSAFYPCYGLAEATLIVTGGRRARPPASRRLARPALERAGRVQEAVGSSAVTVVGCGRALGGTRLRVVDPETRLEQPSGQIGEIWLASEAVGQGYWNRPEESQAVFAARLADTGDGPFLRTGDLGFVADDELHLTGRLKDVIVVRGRNLYPHDIEVTAGATHSALRPGGGAAFSILVDDAERLVVLHEVDVDTAPDLALLAHDVRGRITEEHAVRPYAVVFIAPRTIPKTSSGKLQRAACRAEYLEGTLHVVHTWHEPAGTDPSGWDEKAGDGRMAAIRAALRRAAPGRRRGLLEEHLRDLVVPLLGENVARLPPDAPLSTLGLDSHMICELTERLELSLGIPLSATTVFNHPTTVALVGHLLEQLERRTGDGNAPEVP